MTRKKSASVLSALALSAALGLAAAAQAQEPYGYYPAPPSRDDAGYDSYAPPYSLDELTVTAPRERLGRSPTTGAPIERVSTSRVVSARDLDLRTPWGVDTLYQRIDRAARAACRELDTMYPITMQDDPPCVRGALQDAYLQADDLIAAASNP